MLVNDIVQVLKQMQLVSKKRHLTIMDITKVDMIKRHDQRQITNGITQLERYRKKLESKLIINFDNKDKQ